MGKIKIPRDFGNIFRRRLASGRFLVFDIGTFGVKALNMLGEEVRGFASRKYSESDLGSEGAINEKTIRESCRFALNDLRARSGRGAGKPQKVILGIGGGFVHGKTMTQSCIRDHPEEELSEGEFSNIIQKVQQRNFEQIRRDFKKETGRSELDVRIIKGVLGDVRIGGHQVVNPIGFKGKEVSCGLFNSYMPKDHLKIFISIMSSLNLDAPDVFSQPHAVFSSFYENSNSAADFILVDMGGSATEISLARKGQLDDVRSIPMGGSSFTRSISESLKVGLWEAENIKKRFSESKMGKSAAKKIAGILTQDVDLFLRSMEMILSDLSQLTLLPSSIYLYGGGALMPLVASGLAHKKWRDSLSFSTKPVISMLAPSDVGYPGESLGPNPIWTVPFALARAFRNESNQGDVLGKLVKRSIRLIQD